MTVLVFRYVLSSCAVAAMLSGCGGSQPPIGTPGAMAQTAASHVWKASSSSGDLLYVGSGRYGVSILSYPQGQLVTQFQPPGGGGVLGMCSDQSGDVFVTAAGGNIYEYAHGGTSPIAALDDENFDPSACAVDPTTGNLAVADNGYGDIAIYANAQGTPTYYADLNMFSAFYCAYDDSGNLFVDGQYEDGSPLLGELPNGSGSFTDVILDRKIGQLASMQWMGGYLAVSSSRHVVYHVKISGSSGSIVGKTVHHRLESPWTIDGNQLISVYGKTRIGAAFEIAYWTYPKGGAATQVFSFWRHSSLLDGVAISVGSEK